LNAYKGERLTESLAEKAGEVALNACSTITDSRASAEYRCMLIKALTKKSILQIATVK
jgi:CO/xanthine dehydrogenase FAD-binding subunit